MGGLVFRARLPAFRMDVAADYPKCKLWIQLDDCLDFISFDFSRFGRVFQVAPCIATDSGQLLELRQL